MTLGPVAFLAPWLLGALVLLPVLWWLLRAVPPAPGRVTFPGVRLLLGLRDAEKMPERTPWWLLLLRLVALAAAILAFAGPVLNPRPERGDGPLLLLLDGGWADAPGWSQRLERLSAALEESARDGRPVSILEMTASPPEGAPAWRSAAEWQDRLPGLTPAPFAPDRAGWAAWAAGLAGRADADGFETLWLADGLTHPGAEPAEAGALATALAAEGPVTVALPPATALALGPPRLSEGTVEVEVLRAGAAASGPGESGAGAEVGMSAVGPDPNGIERVLGTATARSLRAVLRAVEPPCDRRRWAAALRGDRVAMARVALTVLRREGVTGPAVDPVASGLLMLALSGDRTAPVILASALRRLARHQPDETRLADLAARWTAYVPAVPPPPAARPGAPYGFG